MPSIHQELEQQYNDAREREIEQLKEVINELREYAQCLNTCWSEQTFDAPCNCGLQDLLHKIKG